ncbi:hypothetical protein [Sphingorhabdus sp.]|uniref:hypothetical protein n=1 Tax=Sphingorhabdus sp. TaxID=1902408 RepID=UPI0032B73DDA
MAYPCPGLAVAGGQGFVEEKLPQFLSVQAFVDHLQKTVEAHRHGQHFGCGQGGIDAVEQGE